MGSPGHHPRDCDELVDVCKKTQIVALNSFKSKGPSSLTLRVEAPHVLGLVRVKGHHLHLVAEDGVGILLEEELVDAMQDNAIMSEQTQSLYKDRTDLISNAGMTSCG